MNEITFNDEILNLLLYGDGLKNMLQLVVALLPSSAPIILNPSAIDMMTLYAGTLIISKLVPFESS